MSNSRRNARIRRAIEKAESYRSESERLADVNERARQYEVNKDVLQQHEQCRGGLSYKNNNVIEKYKASKDGSYGTHLVRDGKQLFSGSYGSHSLYDNYSEESSSI